MHVMTCFRMQPQILLCCSGFLLRSRFCSVVQNTKKCQQVFYFWQHKTLCCIKGIPNILLLYKGMQQTIYPIWCSSNLRIFGVLYHGLIVFLFSQICTNRSSLLIHIFYGNIYQKITVLIIYGVNFMLHLIYWIVLTSDYFSAYCKSYKVHLCIFFNFHSNTGLHTTNSISLLLKRHCV